MEELIVGWCQRRGLAPFVPPSSLRFVMFVLFACLSAGLALSVQIRKNVPL